MTDKRIWVVRAGSGGRHASEFEEHGLVAFGAAATGTLVGLSREETRVRVAECLPDASAGKLQAATGQYYRFANEMAPGDNVITPDGETRELLYGEVAGEYEYLDEPIIGGYHHSRSVHWLGRKPRDVLPQRVLYSLGSVLTVFIPKGQGHLAALIEDRPTSDDALELDTDDETDEEDLFADLHSRSEELIQARIAQLDGYEAQHLVAGVLRAMGYHTRVSPEGADGGVDIVASRDPLAVEPPILKVQVKARPTSRSGAPDLRELAGVLAAGERGVFVSTGGFSRDAQAEAASRRITLVDIDRLQELLVQYYDDLDQDTKSYVPLRRLYFP